MLTSELVVKKSIVNTSVHKEVIPLDHKVYFVCEL